jgi:hypothetical protein
MKKRKIKPQGQKAEPDGQPPGPDNPTAEPDTQNKERTIRDLVNTPFKKAMFAVQILSYILIVGSPLIGGAIGGILGMKATRIGGLILAIFITGEVLFYGSLIFLGKELVLLIRDQVKRWFRKRKKGAGQDATPESN